MVKPDWNNEVEKGKRFKFGENWKRFVNENLDEKTINGAIESTQLALEKAKISFENINVIDIGCGSGLFSLVALRLGAKHVTCFDYDPDSVNCTKELLESHQIENTRFTCLEGSVLDEEFVNSLGKFDLVYSWGVLHHTGNLNKAIKNATNLVNSDGYIFLALYQETFLDYFWKIEKKIYSSSNKYIQSILSFLWITKTKISFAIKGLSFREMVESYKSKRGMNYYKNVHDWLGGYPYEGIKSNDCISFLDSLGFVNYYTFIPGKYWSLSSGCNEYIFRKK